MSHNNFSYCLRLLTSGRSAHFNDGLTFFANLTIVQRPHPDGHFHRRHFETLVPNSSSKLVPLCAPCREKKCPVS